jgi:hypothetical protein
MTLGKRSLAEFIGTFWLVFGGCGSAVLAAGFPALGIGFVGVAFAFGLTVLTMAYAIGHISGCHLNPAVSVGLAVAKRFPASELPSYIIAQVVGAFFAAAVLFVIASGKAGFDLSGGFASNGYGAHSPGGYAFGACLVAEVVHVSDDHPGLDGPPRTTGIRAHRHRTGADADTPDRHSGNESFREPGAQHGAGVVRGWMGGGAAMAFLAGAHCGRRASGYRLPALVWTKRD